MTARSRKRRGVNAGFTMSHGQAKKCCTTAALHYITRRWQQLSSARGAAGPDTGHWSHRPTLTKLVLKTKNNTEMWGERLTAFDWDLGNWGGQFEKRKKCFCWTKVWALVFRKWKLSGKCPFFIFCFLLFSPNYCWLLLLFISETLLLLLLLFLVKRVCFVSSMCLSLFRKQVFVLFLATLFCFSLHSSVSFKCDQSTARTWKYQPRAEPNNKKQDSGKWALFTNSTPPIWWPVFVRFFSRLKTGRSKKF